MTHTYCSHFLSSLAMLSLISLCLTRKRKWAKRNEKYKQKSFNSVHMLKTVWTMPHLPIRKQSLYSYSYLSWNCYEITFLLVWYLFKHYIRIKWAHFSIIFIFQNAICSRKFLFLENHTVVFARRSCFFCGSSQF